MAKAFSVASWNIEHFGALKNSTKKPKKAVKPIIEYLASQKADIIAIYEVVGKYVFRDILECMPDYHFHITEGPQMQEILIGVKKKITAFTTQKLTFKSGQTTLRPGVLVTPLIDGEYYPLLFLHLKSMQDPKGFGLRDDMLKRSLEFSKSLDKATKNGKANYMFLGDLNTMGFDYPYKGNDISAEKEIAELDRRCTYKNMRRPSKSNELTWWNGSKKYSPGSNLDHVIAADHLKFKNLNGSEVSVRGWIDQETDQKKKQWIDTFSDHCLLYFEVQKV